MSKKEQRILLVGLAIFWMVVGFALAAILPSDLRWVGLVSNLIGPLMAFPLTAGVDRLVMWRRGIHALQTKRPNQLYLIADSTGKVIQSGRDVRCGPGQEARLVELPDTKWSIDTTLMLPVGDDGVRVNVCLKPKLDSEHPEWNVQELWDKIASLGLAGVDTYIERAFLTACHNEEVKSAFENYTSHRHRMKFLCDLATAVHQAVRLKWLANISYTSIILRADDYTQAYVFVP